MVLPEEESSTTTTVMGYRRHIRPANFSQRAQVLSARNIYPVVSARSQFWLTISPRNGFGVKGHGGDV